MSALAAFAAAPQDAAPFPSPLHFIDCGAGPCTAGAPPEDSGNAQG